MALFLIDSYTSSFNFSIFQLQYAGGANKFENDHNKETLPKILSKVETLSINDLK